MSIEIFLSDYRDVFRVAILLEYHILDLDPVPSLCSRETVLQDFNIKTCIHCPVNPRNEPWAIPCHASPHHETTPPKLSLPLTTCTCILVMCSSTHAHKMPSDRIRFILVSSDRITRRQSSTVQCSY